MTIAELRTLVTQLKETSGELHNASRKLNSLLFQVDSTINPTGILAPAISLNVDQIVAIYYPPYAALLTEIETITDALGTDALH